MNDNRPERRPDMRAADSDRDQIAERLADALAEGRLDLGEYDTRLQQAMAAKTLGELERIVDDLPLSKAQLESERQAAEERRRNAARKAMMDRWRGWFGIAVLLNVIWLFTVVSSGNFVFYWPALPLGIMAAINLAHGAGDGRNRR
jgi:Domain of unknown function (DUF1707)